MPKVSEYPEETAPDPTRLMDVHGGGITERMTIDNLAASTAFSSRYSSLDSLTVVNYSGSWPARPAVTGTVLFVNATNNTAPSDADDGDLLLRTDTA